MWILQALFELNEQNVHVKRQCLPQRACRVEQMKTVRDCPYLHGTDEKLWCEDTECLELRSEGGSLREARTRSVGVLITVLGFNPN